MAESNRFPALFLGLRAPSNALLTEDKYVRALQSFVKSHPVPSAIVVFSSYWTTDNIIELTGSEELNPIVSNDDDLNIIKSLYNSQKGNPALARSIAYSLKKKGIKSKINKEHGLDYGALFPINLMYPEGDISIIQISIPIQKSPKTLFRLGQSLKKFRNENILFIGSGNIVFNKKVRHQTIDDPASSWAKEFDDFIEENMFKDIDNLFDYEEQGPDAAFAVTNPERINPMFFVLGLKYDDEKVKTLFEGFEFSTTSLRSFFLQKET